MNKSQKKNLFHKIVSKFKHRKKLNVPDTVSLLRCHAAELTKQGQFCSRPRKPLFSTAHSSVVLRLLLSAFFCISDHIILPEHFCMSLSTIPVISCCLELCRLQLVKVQEPGQDVRHLFLHQISEIPASNPASVEILNQLSVCFILKIPSAVF
ncbi:hypothetical protein EK904_011550 [Melospiza melodia maxima]|nr:hypothetical protein EK904_011550 [Melospiza melodia maxima]